MVGGAGKMDSSRRAFRWFAVRGLGPHCCGGDWHLEHVEHARHPRDRGVQRNAVCDYLRRRNDRLTLSCRSVHTAGWNVGPVDDSWKTRRVAVIGCVSRIFIDRTDTALIIT